MKRNKRGAVLALTIGLELIASPIVPVVQAQSGANTINAGLRALGNVYNSVSNTMNQQNPMVSPQMTMDMAKLSEQQSPLQDKYFNAQKLSQIPGLAKYLSLNNINPSMLECRTLATTLYEARPEVCRLGVTNDRNINPQIQLSQMTAYYNGYFQVNKLYRNYKADSNVEGQPFGIGCMNNAMNILNGFFKYRLDELDKLTTNLEAAQAQFREASKSDLAAIEEAVAVLEGGDSNLTDKVRSKKPDLFDFAKRFNNPACNSMFAGTTLNDTGRANGLSAISRDVKKLLTTNNGFSGESYSESHNAIVEDIGSVADKVAKQFELNFTPNMVSGDYSKFVSSTGALVSSSTGIEKALRADLFADVQTKFLEDSAKLTQEKQIIQKELGSNAERALSFMGSKNSGSFDAELTTIENDIKNRCLNTTIGSSEALLSKIYDPTASKHANQNASNFLKDKLRQILGNDQTSIEYKLNALKTLEQGEGNRYYMRMENSYEVQEIGNDGNIKSKVVDATTKRTPSVFFSDIIKNCNAQFKANKMGNQLTGEGAISKLRALNQSYKQLAKTQAAEMKKDIKKKLIECSSPAIATNKVPGSCKPDLFNPSTPNFCANAALSCSKNMQACSKQAEAFVKEIKDQKTARVNNYKALVEKNKQDVVKIFDSALSTFMKEGEAMRAIFGAGFSSPAGVKRDVPEGSKYLTEFSEATGRSESSDGKLLLEDPDKFIDMFKGNVALLKKSVEDQQNQILGGNSVGTGKNQGLLADHIKKTEKNYSDIISESKTISDECWNRYNAAVQAADADRKAQQQEYMKNQRDEAEKQSKLGEKQREYCKRFDLAVTNHPAPACSGGISDLVSALPDVGNDLEIYCDETQSSSSSSAEQKATRICSPYSKSLSPIEKEIRDVKKLLREEESKFEKSAEDLEDKIKELAETKIDSERTKLNQEITKLKISNERNKTNIEKAEKKLTKLDNELIEFNKKLPATTSNNANSNLKSACESLLACMEPDELYHSGKGDPITKAVCKDSKIKAQIAEVLEKADQEPVLTAHSAPYFCNAGDNSGRNGQKNINNFTDTFDQALSGEVRTQ